jgi:hypothetical protein
MFRGWEKEGSFLLLLLWQGKGRAGPIFPEGKEIAVVMRGQDRVKAKCEYCRGRYAFAKGELERLLVEINPFGPHLGPRPVVWSERREEMR